MLKKTITYVDFNDKEKTEDFYFNLTKAELTKLHYSKKGGLQAFLSEIVEAEDVKEVLALFETLVLAAYGEKSDDGRRFMKTEEIWTDFKSTEAYSELFMDILGDAAGSGADFINALMPKDLIEAVEKQTGDPKEDSLNQMQGFNKKQ